MRMAFEDVRSALANHGLTPAARANALSAAAALAETWAVRLPGLQSNATDESEILGAMNERIEKLEELAADVDKARDGNADLAKFADILREVSTSLCKAARAAPPGSHYQTRSRRW